MTRPGIDPRSPGSLVNTLPTGPQDIRMEFGKEKCAMLIMRSRKRYVMEEIELQNEEKNQKAQRKRNLQILGNIGSGHHQTSEDERKN